MYVDNFYNLYPKINLKGLPKRNPDKENIDNIPTVKRPIYKKVSPYILAGLMLVGIKTCSNENAVNYQSEDTYGNMKIECVNVKQEEKDSIVAPVLELKSKLNKENDFLDGVEINIVDNYKSLKDNHSFKTFLKNEENTKKNKGCSLYSDNRIKRVIVIQRDAHGFADRMQNYVYLGINSEMPTMKQTMMHEVGHHFDKYFGHDHNNDVALKWDSIVSAKDKDPNSNLIRFNMTDEEYKISEAYRNSSGLSDKDEFKEAILKDFHHIADLKKKNAHLLSSDYEYYTRGIDLSKPITMDDIHSADAARSEVYANLFGYAMGEEDGDKKNFLENFQNSFKVVKNDINKYIEQ